MHSEVCSLSAEAKFESSTNRAAEVQAEAASVSRGVVRLALSRTEQDARRRTFGSTQRSADVPAASMPADWLVQRRVKEEQTLVDRIQDVKASNLAMLRCEWQNARERSDVGVRQMQESKKISGEMEQGQKELLALRQARMKEFLAAEAQECAPRRAQPTASRAPPAHRPPQPAGLSSS